MTVRTDLARIRVTTEPMLARATALPPDRAFRSTLRDGASVLLGGVEAAARSLPGGEIVAAAIHGGASVRVSGGGSAMGSTGAGASGSSPSGASDPGEALLGSSDSSMQLIELQQQIQEENRRYSTLSNVLKARHETAKTAIGNLR